MGVPEKTVHDIIIGDVIETLAQEKYK